MNTHMEKRARYYLPNKDLDKNKTPFKFIYLSMKMSQSQIYLKTTKSREGLYFKWHTIFYIWK